MRFANAGIENMADAAQNALKFGPPEHPTYDLRQVLQAALDEDLGVLGDITSLSTMPAETQARAVFVAKSSGTVAGVAVVDQVFQTVDPTLQTSWAVADGRCVSTGDELGTVQGSARSILRGERVALNFLQRMSGIATTTAAMVEAAKGYPARILDTRKTVPGLRLLDKWAVLLGGGQNHRMGLFDMVMIKDNHIASAGGITAAVQNTQAYLQEHNLKLPIEVETSTLAEVEEVLHLLSSEPNCMISRVMLDNMARRDPSAEGGVDVTLIEEAVRLVAGKVPLEASGNVSMQSVRAIAATGVSYISCGALTHSVQALDISLKVDTY